MAVGGTHPLLARARSASEQLADLPGVADVIADLDRSWPRRPWVLGLGGAHGGRASVLNHVFAHEVLAAADRDGECATLRVRRGVQTRFLAKRRDGTTESHALPVRPRDPEARQARAEDARRVHRDRETALAGTRVPRWVTSWLLWPFALLWRLFHRGAMRQHQLAAQALVAADVELAAAEADLAGLDAEVRIGRTRYYAALRALGSSTDVLELVVELADGPLPADVELVERSPAVMLDAIVELERDAVTAGGFALGELAAVLPALPATLADARALRLARRVIEIGGAAIAKLDVEIDHAQADFTERIAHLDDMRIADRAGFREVQLARIRPQIFASAHSVIEHASAHLGSELASLGADWIGAIAGASTSDELKEVTARIEATGAASAHRIADETRILVSGGAAGSAHDLIPTLLTALVPYGLPDSYVRERRNAPALPVLELLPSLARATDAKLSGSALANLFRSFDTRRSDVREKVHTRIEHLREVAAAELLDVEPQLNSGIEAALDAALVAGLDAHAAWLDRELASARTAIAEARTKMAPTIARRDRARHELAELAGAIATFETANPATAAAATAAT